MGVYTCFFKLDSDHLGMAADGIPINCVLDNSRSLGLGYHLYWKVPSVQMSITLNSRL